ncbi:MAG TPA: hypothetical protein VE093_22980 [Polyangiaceae bacterium]|jgi:hypothetical protein|nr:hypothetical protein [Polyangiaceae bacterium]
MADQFSPPDVGTALTNVPFGELVKATALAIADAQSELDKSALRVAEMMSGSALLRDPVTMLPIDANGRMPVRSEGGVYYTSTESDEKFEPTVVDTRVFFGRELDGTPVKMSMLELGFTPTFYQFVETILEVKIAISLTQSIDNEVKNKGEVKEVSQSSKVSASHNRFGGSFQATSQYQARSTPIDATYSTKYNYAVEGSSLFRTKLVPVPPPAILEQRIRQQMELDMQRERIRTLPAASIEVTPAAPKMSAAETSIKLSARALGAGGEGLIERTFDWTLVGQVPTGVTVVDGVVTRTATSTTGAVSVQVTSGAASKTVTVDLG